jgi:predicted  nucleic acid-binding Zn-ribbon protein
MAEVDGGDILIRIRGDASELEAEIGRAQGALGDLEGSASDAEGSLGDMGDAAGSANKAIQGMSKGGVNGLAMGLRQVNPALGTALMAFSGMKKALPGLNAGTISLSGATRGLSVALKGLAAALGPIGIGLLAGAAAYEAINFAASKYEDQLNDLNKELDQSIKANNQLNTALGGLESMEEQVANGLSLFRGDITETELEIRKFNTQVDAQVAKLINSAKAAKVSDEQSAKNIEGIKARGEALKQNNRELQELQEAEESLTESTKGQADADKEAAKAAAERAAANQANIDALKAQLNEAASESGELIDQTVADLDAAFTEIEMLALRDQEAIQEGISESLGAVASLTQTLSRQLAEENKKTALALFRTSQAAGLVQVAINTQVAISKALAELGPIAGPIAAVGLGLAGAAQAAIIAAQPAPAHMGDPLAPDERQVSGRRVLATETVLDSATTRRMGGEDGLRQAMRGGSVGGQPVQVNLTYKHLDREVARLMRSNSRTRRAVRS